MSRKLKKNLIRILVASVLLIIAYLIAHFVPITGYWQIPVFLVPYFVIGYDILIKAGRHIVNGQMMDENLLMTIATVGAFAIGEYPEAVFVMLFYQVGEWFQSYAVGKSRRSIAELMSIRPDTATLLVDDKEIICSPEEVEVGSLLLIRPGEKIPLDGVIESGESQISNVALTGESVPVSVKTGDEICSGCVNLSGLLTLRVSKPFSQSTVMKLLELVENASSNKARSEQFITRFSRYYTPVVVAAAVLVALLPPLFVGAWLTWLHRALIFLVVSCPCALVISIPLSFFGGIGGASRKGILVKGSQHMEALAGIKTIVFDKTGTLTHGVFTVTAVHPQAATEEQVLSLAAAVEQFSNHPIAHSLMQSNVPVIDKALIADVKEISGKGLSAVVDGRFVLVGNMALMKEHQVEAKPCHHVGTIVHVASDGLYLGHVVISDKIKQDSCFAVNGLKKQNCSVVMLTGDRQEVADSVAKELNIDQYFAELMPADKVERLELLLKDEHTGSVAFVGDGINDAPVLARADVGIAMGGVGSDAAIEAADVVLMDDKPSKISLAVRIAKKTLRIVKQNIVFALGVKIAVLMLAALGFAPMWLAVFADVGVSFIAILNATRSLRVRTVEILPKP